MSEHDTIIDRIYECSLLPELWCDVLDSLAEMAGARGGLLFAANSEVVNWTSSESIRGGMARFVQSGMFSRSKRVPWLVKANYAGFVRDIDILTQDEMANDPSYRDLLWPVGLGASAGTLVRFPTSDLLILSVEKERALGPVDLKIVSMFDSLRPHIARSALLSARLQLERARVASETLALLGLPAFVFDSVGRILVANTLTETLGEHIRWRSKDRLSLKDRSADALLQQALSSLDTDAAGLAGC